MRNTRDQTAARIHLRSKWIFLWSERGSRPFNTQATAPATRFSGERGGPAPFIEVKNWPSTSFASLSMITPSSKRDGLSPGVVIDWGIR